MLFLSLFASGFEDIVAAAISAEAGAKAMPRRVSSGLVLYDFGGDARALARLPFLSNTFVVFKTFDGSPTFDRMAELVRGIKHRLPGGMVKKGMTFRVRFTRANKFEGVPKRTRDLAERTVALDTGLAVNRDGAELEFWYISRTEGGGYYAMQLPRPRSESPRKGELRPDLAALVVRWSGALALPRGATVLDPFAGSGALPLAVTRATKDLQITASDINPDAVNILKTRLPRATVACADARRLDGVANGSVSLVLTDPPWGLYDASAAPSLVELYEKTLAEVRRVLTSDGSAVFMTARDFDLGALACACGFGVSRRLDILVNGKKATLHELKRL